MRTEFPPLLEILSRMPDPRHRQGTRHPLPAILGLMCVATLCGYRSYSAMSEWGRHYGRDYLRLLGLTRDTPPSPSTLCVLLRRVDIRFLETLLTEWTEAVLSALPPSENDDEAFAMDGKTQRGSKQQGAPLHHLLAVVSQRLGTTLAQRAVIVPAETSQADAEHTNEIPVAAAVLRGLLVEGRLQGRLFTMDALLTQREIAETITEGGGDYVMPVKANQPQLLEDIRLLFEHPDSPKAEMESAHTWDSGHGRIEYRRLMVSDALKDYVEWPGAWQVFQIHRQVTVTRRGVVTAFEETRYGVTSLSPTQADATRLLRLVRAHWRIENGLHWVRDVTFDEDRSQVRSGSTPEVMAAFRNVAIGALHADGVTNIAAGCRRLAAQPKEAFRLIGIRLE